MRFLFGLDIWTAATMADERGQPHQGSSIVYKQHDVPSPWFIFKMKTSREE